MDELLIIPLVELVVYIQIWWSGEKASFDGVTSPSLLHVVMNYPYVPSVDRVDLINPRFIYSHLNREFYHSPVPSTLNVSCILFRGMRLHLMYAEL